MPKLMIFLLGGFHCEINDTGAVSLEARRAQELLAYLALFRSHTYHRDQLSGLLWGDRSDYRAKKTLRQALWLLQSALHNHASAKGNEYLYIEGESIGLHPQADIWVDAGELEFTYFKYESHKNMPLGITEASEIRTVSEMYEGDLLEGWYWDWCLHERERFQFMYLSLLDRLLGFYETSKDYEGAINCGMKILQCDSARESTHRRMMRLHYLAGHRTHALHQYAACVTALKEELGVAPARSTQHLYQQICRDAIHEISHALDPDLRMSTETTSVAPDEPLSNLLEIRQVLESMRQQVDYLITTMT